MSDATQKCPSCGAVLPGRAKFCAECGTTMKAVHAPGAHPGGPPAAATPILPWFIAGVCVLAVFAMVIIIAVRRPEPAAGNQSNVAAPGRPSSMTGTTDISSMSPREAADRLFDRIARASEAGDTGQVNFFGPMTIQAYAQVSPLDADARLHIGMVHMAMGNAAGATAQADSIVRQSRTHLFGPLLKVRVAEAANNATALRQAYQTFLANWTAERAKNLPEYEQHATMLNELHTAAQGSSSR
jgi:hypothetical protein